MRPILFAPLLLAASLCLPPAAAQTPLTDTPPPLQPLTVDEAFSSARFAAPRLSPDGRYLALLAARRGRMGLSIFDLQEGRYESHIGFIDADIAQPMWLGNGRLLYTLDQHGQSRKTQLRQGGLFVISRDGQQERKLHATFNDWVNSSRRRYTSMTPVQAVPDSDEEFIGQCNDVDKDSVDLYRVNAATGKRQLLTAQRPARTIDWVLDPQLEPRVAISDVERTTERVVHYRDADGRWRELWRFRTGRDDVRLPVSVEPDGKLLVATNEGRDTVALREYDPASAQWGDVLIEHPSYDVAVDAFGDDIGVLLRSANGELLGVEMDTTRPVFAWMDERRRRLQTLVDQALPGRINALQFSASSQVFVSSRSDTEVARWYLLDSVSGRLREVLNVQPGLDARRVPATETLALRTRDGLPLSAHVLRPPQASPAAPLPTIVIVHGGPWVRGATWGDADGDMAMARWLASRGYQVLLPSFRGSTGFGKRFALASRGQIGLAMQDDVDDALDALIQRGVADPQRLCIMGASYGGYASLMAVARTPDRYRCAVASFPVSDLARQLTSDWGDLSRHHEARALWIDMTGDPVKDKAALDAVSPRYLASRIKARVMIVAGQHDQRTPLEQAEFMRDALRRAGNEPLWLAKFGEGHGFSLRSSHQEMLDMLEPFLAEQLAPLKPHR
ncbi:alpha/beta fold hydrolase [Roseateles cellulosilyticus]|uniref:Alpha/beta fold hydrolase n=1 Tax=Pelomonas cellulosilytica TaxID=2906762 RepID=A0ABS8XY54_9BURK|nr:prolyl oligopeptidase family serine peptidase [Pelomonas sp. P8]MCE4556610.1 alpha/beta fold hydrolase [Pelomonas sp. P8]